MILNIFFFVKVLFLYLYLHYACVENYTYNLLDNILIHCNVPDKEDIPYIKKVPERHQRPLQDDSVGDASFLAIHTHTNHVVLRDRRSPVTRRKSGATHVFQQ